jgi:mannan endo-1,4-beta-mannosidase
MSALLVTNVTALLIAVVLLRTGSPPPAAPPPPPRLGFYVADGGLYDANNMNFVMRGVGHAHATHPDDTAGAMARIKSLGANTIRVEISTGAVRPRNNAADVANLVTECKNNRLICVLVVHDSTGWGARPNAITQAEAVDYWLDLKDVLAGQEKYVIINIANEPYVLDNYFKWPAETMDSIKRLREAGFRHTLMVDAPDWGQDRSFTMRDNAAAVFNSDPELNTVFSIHMYGAFYNASLVADYLNSYVGAKLPIVISEFAYTHLDGDVDEDAIMSEAQAHGIGYLGWSWSGNGGGLDYLDMVKDFDGAALTAWGQRIFYGPNGIQQTAREASVYAR